MISLDVDSGSGCGVTSHRFKKGEVHESGKRVKEAVNKIQSGLLENENDHVCDTMTIIISVRAYVFRVLFPFTCVYLCTQTTATCSHPQTEQS